MINRAFREDISKKTTVEARSQVRFTIEQLPSTSVE
jgi:hypothetical protein